MIERVVAPVDQRYPPAVVEVNVTVLPDVITLDPLREITGTAGGVQPFALTIAAVDVFLQPLLPVTVTLYEPCVFTTTDLVVEPLDQAYAFAVVEVRVTEV